MRNDQGTLLKSMPTQAQYERTIIDVELDANGHFKVPKKLDTKQETEMCIRKTHATFQENYADSERGQQDSIDPDGGYCCAGNAAGTSGPCNRLILATGECIIRTEHPDDPHYQSCKWWHRKIAGDPQVRLSDADKAKNTDEVIGFGKTTNPRGFGCIGKEDLAKPRCEYGAKMEIKTSDGQEYFCILKGFSVDVIACCGKNPGQNNKTRAGSAKSGIGHKILGVA